MATPSLRAPPSPPRVSAGPHSPDLPGLSPPEARGTHPPLTHGRCHLLPVPPWRRAGAWRVRGRWRPPHDRARRHVLGGRSGAGLRVFSGSAKNAGQLNEWPALSELSPSLPDASGCPFLKARPGLPFLRFPHSRSWETGVSEHIPVSHLLTVSHVLCPHGSRPVIPPLLLILLLPPCPRAPSQTSVPAWSEQTDPMSSVGRPTLPVWPGPRASRAPGRS